jgi:acid phosphatase (class A)
MRQVFRAGLAIALAGLAWLGRAHGAEEACTQAATRAAHQGTLTRLAQALPHYESLARLSSAPQPRASGLDRRQFDLSSMRPGYLKTLGLAPAYLDVPATGFVVPEFPANSSEQTRGEIEFLLKLEKERTPETVAESQRLAGVYYRNSVKPEDADYPAMRRNLFHMGRQLGAWFSPDTLPVTADFMARVWSDASYYIWAHKFRSNRARPYQLDGRLQNLEDPNFPAYPSGHAGNSYVAAYVYEQLLPEHRELFLANARDMAYSREILGVHFPSDSEAGRLLARQIVDRLLTEPAFTRDLAAARAEIAAAHQKAGARAPFPLGNPGRAECCF